MASFLRKNFPGCAPKNFFLFVACDATARVFPVPSFSRDADGPA